MYIRFKHNSNEFDMINCDESQSGYFFMTLRSNIHCQSYCNRFELNKYELTDSWSHHRVMINCQGKVPRKLKSLRGKFLHVYNCKFDNTNDFLKILELGIRGLYTDNEELYELARLSKQIDCKKYGLTSIKLYKRVDRITK